MKHMTALIPISAIDFEDTLILRSGGSARVMTFWYLILTYTHLSLSAIQCMYFFKPITTIILSVIYHQVMSTMVGMADWDETGLVREVAKGSMGASWGTVFEGLMMRGIKKEIYKVNEVNKFLKYSLRYDSTNFLLNASSLIGIILSYFLIAIPVLMILALYGRRKESLKPYWRMQRLFDSILRGPFLKQLLILFLLTFFPLLLSSLCALTYSLKLGSLLDVLFNFLFLFLLLLSAMLFHLSALKLTLIYPFHPKLKATYGFIASTLSL